MAILGSPRGENLLLCIHLSIHPLRHVWLQRLSRVRMRGLLEPGGLREDEGEEERKSKAGYEKRKEFKWIVETKERSETLVNSHKAVS
jgi:hypothetical protein